jgi:excisionase family DNA binding protein
MSRDHGRRLGAQERQALDPRWYTVSQVAQLLGYGETKVRMLIISGDLRSLKDGRSRRVLPEWVEDYVRLRASQARDAWD